MKKLICMLLSLTMCLSFASCTQTPADSSSEQTSVGSSSDELKALQDQILALQNEKADLTSQLTEKTSQIDRLTSENAELKEFEDTYGDFIDDVYGKIYFNTGNFVSDHFGWVDFVPGESDENVYERIENLPKYKEGSIKLEPRQGFSGRNFHFERKYRLCYYDASLLPLENALRFVRGYEGDEIYNGKLHSTLLNTPEKVYISDCHGFFGEPIMHYYLWFILAYRVSKAEMEQMVEILSDPDHLIYDNWAPRKFTDFSFDNERFELPNVDILYTFDANIINEYYRYA